VQVEHGRLQLGQLNGRDPHGPDITEVVVASLALDSSNLKKGGNKCGIYFFN
jgi:hypothetical protein